MDPTRESPPPAPAPTPAEAASARGGLPASCRKALRLGLSLTLLLGLLLAGTTEALRWVHLQFWEPWTCKPALNLHVFQREEGPFDVVFLGPSTLQRGILPEVLGPALDEAMGRPVRFFSLSQPGPKFRTYRTIARDLLRGDHAPKLTVLIVGGELFLETPQTEDYFRYYAALQDLLLHPGDFGLDDLGSAAGRARAATYGKAALAGAVRGIPTLWQWLGEFVMGREFHERCEELRRSRGFPELGWDIRYPEAEWRARMKARLAWYRQVQRHVDLKGREARAFEETLEVLEDRHLPTLVVNNVTAPITQDVRESEVYHRILRFYEEACARHGAEFLDLDKASLAPPLRMFNDPYHPNREGAAALSPRWARGVLAPRLRRLEKAR